MNKDLAILPIHGMGKTPRDFADDIRDALKKRLGPVTWKHALGAGVLPGPSAEGRGGCFHPYAASSRTGLDKTAEIHAV